MPIQEENYRALEEKYREDYGDLDYLRSNVVNFFNKNPQASGHVHSVKSRTKDPASLREKIARKWDDADPIVPSNLHNKITDLAGVRVLLLHQEKFSAIRDAIRYRLDRGEWHLFENPKAYTWDPEAKAYFETLGYAVETKPSFYTSVHYVIKEHAESPFYCEVQVRTLFEEIWGEVDHLINYPEPTDKPACRDQILVLAKLIGAGSRLVDSIFSSHRSQ